MIQVTLFPNKGICIGVTDHHAISDGASLVAFLRTWASIHKSNGATEHSVHGSLPFYGRDSVEDSHKLSAFVWEQVKTSVPTFTPTISFPSHKVRSTFILTDGEIKKLKNGMSTFVAICAHIWSCLATSAAAAGEVVQDDVPEYLTSPVDCRRRLNPPLPDNYFGNCLVFMRASCSHGRLKGDGGFVAAADAIAAAVKEAVANGDGILDGFKRKPESFSEWISRNRVIPISGSPRLDPCAADYGWGRAIKYECVHTDYDGAVDLCKGRDGGVVIALVTTKLKMDAFDAIFKKKLYSINSNL